jgi:NitT/TauT family transport system permease protein
VTAESVAVARSEPTAGRVRAIGRRLATPRIWGPLIVLVVVLGAWQSGLFHSLFGFRTFTVPYPDAILAGFGDQLPDLADAIGLTLPAAIVGYIVGLCLGYGISALLVVGAPRLADRLVPLLASANALPIAAVAPLLALWLDGGFHLKVVVVAVMTTPTFVVYVTRGLTSLQPATLELMASYEATPLQVFREVRVPSAMPFLFTAMKSCVVLALIGTIISEVVIGFEGLGYVIVNSLGAFRTVQGWLALLSIAALGIGWYVLVELAERLAVPWEPSIREQG